MHPIFCRLLHFGYFCRKCSWFLHGYLSETRGWNPGRLGGSRIALGGPVKDPSAAKKSPIESPGSPGKPLRNWYRLSGIRSGDDRVALYGFVVHTRVPALVYGSATAATAGPSDKPIVSSSTFRVAHVSFAVGRTMCNPKMKFIWPRW